MSWYKNPIVLAWIGLIVTAVLTFLGLYFGSDRFYRVFRKNTLKLKLFISSKIWIFINLFVGLIGIFLLANKMFIQFLILFALYMTALAYYERNNSKKTATIVSCKLGDSKSERGDKGLLYVPWEDGNAIRELTDFQYVRRTDVTTGQRYIYFAIDENLVSNFRKREVYIIAEYLDQKNYGELHLHYDSTDRNHPNKAFKCADKIIQFTGTQKWQIAIWKITDGNFKRSQQQQADFRFRRGTASSEESPTGHAEEFDIYVRKVIVVSL